MGWFGEQLRERIQKDDKGIRKNLRILRDAVSGRKNEYYPGESSAIGNIRQIESICHYFREDTPEEISEYPDIHEQIDHIIQPSGITKRRVRLNENWWKNGDGPLLAAVLGTDCVLALLPNRFRGYYYTDPETGKKVKVTRKNKDLFDEEAYCFYKPLPQKSLSGREYVRLLLKEIRPTDVALTVFAAACAVVFGMLTPRVTEITFSILIPSGKQNLLIPLAVLLTAAAIGSWIMTSVKNALSERIANRLDIYAENAVFARVLHLPAAFFSNRSSGDLAQRIIALNSLLPALMGELFCSCLLSLALSLVYIFQIGGIASSLMVPALVTYAAEIAFIIVTVFQEERILREALDGSAENNSIVFDFISGIQKIKISGSEKRAFAQWLKGYTKKASSAFNAAFPCCARMQIMITIQLLGTLWVYAAAAGNGLSTAQFAGFTSAFGLALGWLNALGPSVSNLSYIRPALEMGEPILREVPEQSEGKKFVKSLSGRIDLSGVTFRYPESDRNILDNLSLSIRPGENVAVVGRSGCGKSTLMKLLLGFVRPDKGSIYYDGVAIEDLDKQSLRRNIGSVLQNGRLFTGDIYSNITIAAPWLDMDAAWDAAEKAGIADDIREMPMGMHTYISEASAAFSGGQRQRLIIARAIAPKPNILIFDEATSALDNLSQKVVTDSLNSLSCTRVIIAHRLSTIQDCDRILCLDQGKIVEEGTYNELISRNGFFADLVSRQQIPGSHSRRK